MTALPALDSAPIFFGGDKTFTQMVSDNGSSSGWEAYSTVISQAYLSIDNLVHSFKKTLKKDNFVPEKISKPGSDDYNVSEYK